jgi:hypothetical protein
MSPNLILEQLLDIERSIGVETNAIVRKKVQDAEDSLLLLQKETVDNLRKEFRGNESRSIHITESLVT